jgi:hypothetical protein
MAGNISRRRIAGKSMVVGDEVKAIVLSLKLQVLTHGTEKVAYMKFAGWLYARKYPQVKLLTPKTEKLKSRNINDLAENNAIGRECQELRIKNVACRIQNCESKIRRAHKNPCSLCTPSTKTLHPAKNPEDALRAKMKHYITVTSAKRAS